MRLAVDVVGFTDAAEACCSGNQVAALLTESLSGKLSAYAGMAGDDAMSADFAAGYDDAARESVGALVDLTYAFSSLSRLLATSGDNHGRAEAGAAGRVFSSDTSRSASHFVHVRAPAPPSSLGANDPGLGMVETWILDHVEGFVWPGADVERLLDAAAVWRSSASSVADLEHQCDEAITLLERQQSPEVPLATAALAGLRSLIRQAAEEMLAVATSCEEYAEAVRKTHERTVALLSEICQMIVEGVAVSAVVGFFSSGIGAGAAGTAAMARVAAQAPRFHALLVSLRVSTTKAVTRLREASERMEEVRRRAGKYPRVRDERGSIWVPKRPLLPGEAGWLRGHDAPPGHTLRDHVAKSVDELLTRCLTKGKAKSSSFVDERQAEDLVAQVVRAKDREIRAWLKSNSGDDALPLDAQFGIPTGITVTRDGTVIHQSGVRVVLIPNASMPNGWQVLTAFPN